VWFILTYLAPIGPDSSRIGHTLEKICSKETDINALFIQRGTETLRKQRWQTKLESGDIIYVYGARLHINRTFKNELRDKAALLQDEKKSPVVDRKR
jgi:Trk K+ transport system NAD-binding subunit